MNSEHNKCRRVFCETPGCNMLIFPNAKGLTKCAACIPVDKTGTALDKELNEAMLVAYGLVLGALVRESLSATILSEDDVLPGIDRAIELVKEMQK